MKILIRSKKFGNKWCYFDDKDAGIVKSMTWHLRHKNGIFYAGTNYNWNSAKRSGRTITMHRMIMGPNNNLHVDHKNGNGLDNRRMNLRLCNRSQNLSNRKVIQKNNTTGFKGVVFERKKKLYRVMIGVNGVTIRGGRFKNPIDAAKRYNELAVKHHKEFARLNIIP